MIKLTLVHAPNDLCQNVLYHKRVILKGGISNLQLR